MPVLPLSQLYAKQALRPTLPSKALSVRLRPPAGPADPRPTDLLLVHPTWLALLAVDDADGSFDVLIEQDAFGAIRDAVFLRDGVVAVLSDSGVLAFLTLDADATRFVLHAPWPIAAPGSQSLTDLGRLCAVSPDASLLVVAACQDTLAVFPVPDDLTGLVNPAFHINPVQGVIWDVKFLGRVSHNDQRLAVVSVDPRSHAHQVTLVALNPQSGDARIVESWTGLSDQPVAIVPLGETASFLVLTEKLLIHLDASSGAPPRNLFLTDAEGMPEPAFVVGWAQDPESNRFVFMSEAGSLFAMRSPGEPLVLLGQLPSPSGLLAMMPGALLVSPGDVGDGVVAKINFESDSLEVLSQITNLAPVVDSVALDLYDEQHESLYLASGFGVHGSVRLVRNGYGVERIISTGPSYPGISGVWALRARPGDTAHSFLVMSFVGTTRVMTVGAEMEDISDVSGLDLSCTTLAAGSILHPVNSPSIVQVVSAGVRVCQQDAAGQCTVWSPPEGNAISVACVHGDNVVVGLALGFVVVLLAVRDDGQIEKVGECVLKAEPSCLDVCADTAGVVVQGIPLPESLLVVGTYEPALVFLSASTLEVVATQSLVGAASDESNTSVVPESVRILCDSARHVIVGLRDGTLVRYSLGPNSPDGPLLGAPVARRLGLFPIQLVTVAAPGAEHPFLLALADRLCVIQERRGRISFAEIAFSGITHATPFWLQDCPDGMVFMADSCMHVVRILQNSRLTAVRFPLGATPRRIAFHKEQKRLLVACQPPAVRIVDPFTGAVSPEPFALDPKETIYAVEVVGNLVLVGTGEAPAEAFAATTRPPHPAGNLHVLELDPASQQLTRLATAKLPGTVSAIAAWSPTMILAGANSSLFMYQWAPVEEAPAAGDEPMEGDPQYALEELTRLLMRSHITSIKVSMPRVIVSSLGDSVTFLAYRPELRAFETVCGDAFPRKARDAVPYTESLVVGLDRAGCVFTLLASERTMSALCEYNIGEEATRIHRGSLVYRQALAVEHRLIDPLLVPTFSGGVVALIPIIDAQAFQDLLALQRKLDDFQQTRPLFVNTHDRYRTAGGRPSKGVVDGDFVSQFLYLSQEERATIAGDDADRLCRLIEECNERIL